ncbi:MAG: ribosome small subunit-dependent GTPase A [Verrucomicrobiae bacterium]|nr:ribosome small subunit-dependent GTPase A [Verrucomicrobiae bacterium]
MVELEALGWDGEWERAFAALGDRGWAPGRVALEDKQAFVAVTAEGEVRTRLAGRLLKDRSRPETLPKVGDWVALSRKAGDTRSVVQEVLPRRTFLARKVPGRETAPQVLAANMDVVFVVQSLDATFNLRRLERFLVMVHEGGARGVVVLNKADLAEAVEDRLAEVRATVGATPVLVVSARTRRGLGELRKHVAPGRTAVFVGTSGVGKSSLINRLHGEAIQPTLEVRAWDGKGRHSTTWRELILLPDGGLVIDTPGMREFHMWTAEGGLDEAFPDIAELALGCHFRACSHTSEARCAVRVALGEGRLSEARFASFRKLQRELADLATERRDRTYVLRRRAGRIRRGGEEGGAEFVRPDGADE